MESLFQTRLSKLHELLFSAFYKEIEQEYELFCRKAKEKKYGVVSVIAFLKTAIEEVLVRQKRLRNEALEFNLFVRHASAKEELDEHVLRYAGFLGAQGRELEKDRKALNRWFGPESINDRFEIQLNGLERKLSFLLNRLGVISSIFLSNSAITNDDPDKLWKHLGLELLLTPLLVHAEESKTSVEAFRALSTALRAFAELHSESRIISESVVSPATLQFIYRAALQGSLDIWTQIEALELLSVLSEESFCKVIETRLTKPQEGDDFLVRALIVELLAKKLVHFNSLYSLIDTIAKDPSPHVRMQLREVFSHCDSNTLITWLRKLTCEPFSRDSSPQVRAALLSASINYVGEPLSAETFAKILVEVTNIEQDPFVLRVVCYVSETLVENLSQQKHTHVWGLMLRQALLTLHSHNENIAIRRFAAQSSEAIWSNINTKAFRLKKLLEKRLERLARGKSVTIAFGSLRDWDEDYLGRVFSVLSRHDFGYDVERGLFGYRITRDVKRGFRLWRVIHELFHPAPDKRQPFNHCTGRVYHGEIQAPPVLMAELTQTRVPGEPLFFREEQGWRPFLPLLDGVISSFHRQFSKRRTRIFTAEGVTTITTAGFFRGIWSYIKLVKDFAKLSEKRNLQNQQTLDSTANAFVDSLSRYGVDVTFKPHRDECGEFLPIDSSVTRFFNFAPLGFIGSPDDRWFDYLWDQFSEYFVSLHQNTIAHLTIFTAVAVGIFFWNQSRKFRVLRKARKQIPLVIGGWGTRGKSGTERLKAALFSALGAGVVSKTTGCEAMLVQGHPFGRLYEFPIFRPYDKATIWEQREVVCMGVKFNPEVLLWECMALEPSYVDILQQHWMKDDISTITNAYPDHEDVQGPSGLDVAETITRFVPKQAILFTSEELMLPLIEQQASTLRTNINVVGWLEAGLLTDDVLSRFPYSEHPYNIALVLKMAKYLGVSETFALKEMADRVIPDIGVLKKFPPTLIRGRNLQFINAMSANEPYSCLDSWERMGFAHQDHLKNPGEWLVTLVNNRADRLPRSRVFARMLVRELRADRHVLIGGNLKGFRAFIADEWRDYIDEFRLWRSSGAESSNKTASEEFEKQAASFRLPISAKFLAARESIGIDSAFLEKESLVFKRFVELRNNIINADPTNRKEIEAEVREFFSENFFCKFVVLEDYTISGEGIISELVDAIPKGMRATRVFGAQNIKGTGLDFVYRWLDWERCKKICDEINQGRKSQVQRALLELSKERSFGQLAETYVTDTINKVRHLPVAQEKDTQVLLDIIQSNLEKQREQLLTEQSKTSKSGLVISKWQRCSKILAHCVSECFDVARSVERKFRAERIFKDLGSQRISRAQASKELWRLYREQYRA